MKFLTFNQAQFVQTVDAFLRATGIPNQTWNQAAWFIDPSNASGRASDSNDGATSLTPLLTYKSLYQRWGTTSPNLGQNTTITQMSDQPDFSDPVVLSPTVNDPSGNGILNLIGTPVTVATGFTLAVTQAKNRAANQRWEIQANGQPGGFWAPYVGLLVHDTTQNCFFWVDADLGGGVALITEPMSPADPLNPIATMVPPVTGDSFSILAPTKAFMPVFLPITASGTTSFVSHMWMVGPNDGFGLFGSTVTSNLYVVESRFDSFFVGGAPTSDFIGLNCMFQGGLGISEGELFAGSVNKPGGFSGLTIEAGFPVLLDADIAIDNFMSVSGTCVIGTAYLGLNDSGGTLNIPNAFTPGQGTLVISTNAGFYGPGQVWGPVAFAIHGGGALLSDEPWATALLNTGATTLDGSGNASAYDSGTGLWHAGRAITPANLDLAVGGGGFGGTAYGNQGSKIQTIT